jgi:hypothetical protein
MWIIKLKKLLGLKVIYETNELALRKLIYQKMLELFTESKVLGLCNAYHNVDYMLKKAGLSIDKRHHTADLRYVLFKTELLSELKDVVMENNPELYKVYWWSPHNSCQGREKRIGMLEEALRRLEEKM